MKFPHIMDKKEVITLSSDDESDFTRTEHRTTQAIPPQSKKGFEDFVQSCLNRYKEISVKKNVGVVIEAKKQRIEVLGFSKFQKRPQETSQNVPEIVDLEECSEKSVENEEAKLNCTNDSSKIEQNHSSPKVIDIDEVTNNPTVEEIKVQPNLMKHNTNSLTNYTEKVLENSSEDAINELKPEKEETHKNEGLNQNLKFFTEFVEYCGSLEVIPNDRAKLTKKMMKRYGEADSKYIKSPEFKILIQKCKAKVNKNNLYLIAKEITEELSFRKKVAPNSGKPNIVEEKCQIPSETVKENEIIEEKTNKQSKKRTKVINKILKKLDKLGCKIRELEEKEVDLNDEEESTYLQLQRYRDRFCQIYTKLCKYTNEIADADRVCNRKICFTESKYPAINRCIENWLNKTKRFPDFTDIMKLLESQSSSLGLPCNRESIRTIASEIFQQVGAMLQRRRKYDLWDSFCGFLDEGEDPADKDPLLDRILRNNFDARVKKEQEIFQHYVELQEKERLEPEEVPDDEANRSPVDSGNEDEKEIEEVEESMNKRVDDEIKKDTQEETGDNPVKNSAESPAKESKNNFRNCKSLKWRLENGVKGKDGNPNVEDPEKEKNPEEESKPEKSDVKMMEQGEGTLEANTVAKSNGIEGTESTLKRKHEDEDPIPNKKAKNKENAEDLDIFEIEDESEPITEEKNEVFEIRCCQIYTNTAFEDWDSEKEKEWDKRKVFRDLTNVNRLMGLHGRKRKTAGLFSPYFLHQTFFDYDKPSWKKRFKLNFRVSPKGQKCTLNQEGKETTGNLDSGGERDDGEKDVQSNSDGEEIHEEGDDSVSGSGNGSEEDNNGDEERKKERTDEESQNEDEEDEEETEKEEKPEADANEHSFPNEKTEEDVTLTENASTCENEGDKTQVEGISTDSPNSNMANETETKGEEEEEEGSTKSSERDETDAHVTDLNAKETTHLTVKELDIDVEKRNLNIKESTAEEEDLTVKEIYLDDDKTNLNIKETDLGVNNASQSTEEAESTVEEIDLTVKEIKLDDDKTNLNIKETHLNVEKGNENIEVTDSNVEDTDLTVKDIEVDKRNLNTKETELALTESGLDVEKGNVNIETDSDVPKTNVNVEETGSDIAVTDLTVKERDIEVDKRNLNMKEPDVAVTDSGLDVEKGNNYTETDLDVPKTNVNVEETDSEFVVTDSAVREEDKNIKPDVDVQDENLDSKETKVQKTDVPNGEYDLEKIPKNGSTENEDLVEVEKSDPNSGNFSGNILKRNYKIEEKGKKRLPNLDVVDVESENFERRMRGTDIIPRERKRRATTESSTPLTYRKILECQKMARRSTSSTSDEERVKRFLLHSPSSISITPPRTLTRPKPPSQAALQALATLRNLKGISTTIVRGGKPKSEDDVVVVGSSHRGGKQSTRELPVISNVQSIDTTTPKIVTVQGNVSGMFENPWAQVSSIGNPSSSIRISNVWGSLPNNFMQEGEVTPGCSFRQNDPRPPNPMKKKRPKKTVEYVVLD